MRNSRRGGIGLEPVYAADVLYKETSGNVTTAAKNGEIGNTIINELTVGGVKIGSETGFTGISISGSSTSNHVTISDNDMVASGGVFANIIDSGLNARMSDGKVVAKNGLYIGYTSTSIDGATYDNSNFAVNGENGSFKAANGKFNVSHTGAITADSLTLADNYNVKQNIEDAKTRITTVEGDTLTNNASINELKGRVDGHDTDIGALETKTQGITRGTDDSTTVDGVNFKNGAVSGVKSINDNLKFESDGIYLNKGDQTKQIKIDADGKIIIGTSSSAYDTNGFYAGGDDYTEAKAAIDGINGQIKGANGAFGVDDNGNVTTTGDIKGKDITASGKLTVDSDATVGGNLGVTGDTTLKGKLDVTGDTTLKGKLDVTGDTTVGGTLGVTGNATVGGTLGVTGDATFSGNIKGQSLNIGKAGNEFTVDTDGAVIAAGGKVSIDKDGNAQFGDTGANITKIQGKKITTGYIQTDNNIESSIGGVKMQNGKITASNMEITGAISLNDLTVNNKLTVDTFGVTKAGVVTGVTSINDVAVSKQGTGLTIGSATVGDSNPFSSQGYTVDATGNVSAKDITAGKYNGNEITADKKFNGVELDGGNVKATKVTAATITDDNGFTATGGNVTAKNIQADTGTIAGVNFAAGGSVSGISELTATTIKDGAGTIITGGNVESKTAKIGAINIDNETIEGSSAHGLSIEGVKIKDGVMSAVVSIDATKATIGGVNTLDNTGLTVKTGSKVQVGTNTVIEDGSVKVSPKTSLTDQSLQLNDTNKWTQTGGLVADKATVNGIALGTDSKGKATFSDAAGNTTTIDGDKITTGTITADKLLIDKISLGKDGSDNISIDKDGNVTTKGDVTVTGADDDTTVIDGAKATFGKDAANQTTIDKGKISAKAKSTTNQIAEFGFDENGLTVSGQNAAGQKSSFSFNAKTGASTFTGQDGTTTTINGSAITSTKAAGNTGVLDGSNLTLTNGDNKTEMTAGGATFTKDGKTTIISGDTITTGTLNVTDIVLGGTMYDTAGKPLDGKLSIGNDGHLRAANGNFDVKDDGTFKNTVGNTTLKTDTTGASMKFDNTAADGGVKSEVAVADGKAEMAVGANAAVTTTDGKVEIKGGTQTVTTTGDGTVFENSAHKTAFVDNGATNTIINGNEITTGKITTDQLVITGQGNAHGNGSIAFGGNGTIKSDINDGNGKNTSFETKLEGVNTKVTDGTTTTENNVSAAGNSNTVKQDDKHKSEFNQGLTSIGGVVTNGTVKIAQTLDGENGNITNEVIDKDGKSSKLVQSGTGLTYTDSAHADNATRIDSSDVSIGSATEPDKRINLSDLGQIDELDKELTDRDEYKNNPTAVGGINAEAAIRREEVARLDGRINDVNDRVNKVGAMAAAIASLKSIGYDPQAPSEFSIGLGQYKGETGVAMGFFHYPNKNFMINVSLSTAGGETMGGIGATWRFGHKSPQKLLEEQREAQAKKELAAAEKYQAAAKLAKEAQERAEYAAKLARQAQVSADNAKAAADATQAKHFG